MYKGIQKQSVLIQALKLAPAGLSFLVSARRARSCSTRSPAMNLARSDTLHATQEPTFPATREIFGLDLCDTQFAEFRCFLLLVILHTPQYVIEHLYGSQDVRALVQHHTVCALRHRGIRDFRA